MDNNNYYYVKYYLDPTLQLGAMAVHRFWLYVHCDLELRNMTLASNHDTPFGHGQYMWKLLSTSNVELRSYGPDKT